MATDRLGRSTSGNLRLECVCCRHNAQGWRAARPRLLAIACWRSAISRPAAATARALVFVQARRSPRESSGRRLGHVRGDGSFERRDFGFDGADLRLGGLRVRVHLHEATEAVRAHAWRVERAGGMACMRVACHVATHGAQARRKRTSSPSRREVRARAQSRSPRSAPRSARVAAQHHERF